MTNTTTTTSLLLLLPLPLLTTTTTTSLLLRLLAFLILCALFLLFNDVVVELERNGKYVSTVVESFQNAVSGAVWGCCEQRLETIKYDAFYTILHLKRCQTTNGIFE